jgi:ribosomal protein S18 acetylase RimI-like enzyme
MNLSWIREHPPRWDEGKRRIIGEAPSGIFDGRYAESAMGAAVPGEWWRVEADGAVAGYGWMDVVWGDAEVLLATDPEQRSRGIGSFILEQLEREAAQRGLNYVYNVVRPTHPQTEAISAWLMARGFVAQDDGRLLRRASQPERT